MDYQGFETLSLGKSNAEVIPHCFIVLCSLVSLVSFIFYVQWECKDKQEW